MNVLPTDAAVIQIAWRGKSGHHDYDRGIRDNMSDARWFGPTGDPKGQAYWTFRALTLAHLHLMDARYNATCEQIDAAQLAAIATMETLKVSPSGLEYARQGLRNRYEVA